MLLMHLLLSDFSLVLLLLESSSALCDLLCILLLLFYVSKEGYREKVGGDAINAVAAVSRFRLWLEFGKNWANSAFKREERVILRENMPGSKKQ